ncbi:MAG: hypothetical protein HYY18_16785 [Planctomycetes bacterium]|nr:hypothetical protein [Planctomycetota bacterium]
MGRATVYCDRCGAQIAGADFDKGRALSRAGKNYCPECAPQVEPPGEPAGEGRRGTSKIHHPSPAAPRDSDIIRNLQGLGGKPNTGRLTHAGHPAATGHAPPPADSPAAGLSGGMMAAIGGGVLVVTVLLAVILSKSGGDGGGKGGGKESGARALELIEKAESLRGKAPPKEFLDAANLAKREASGTGYAERASALQREALLLVEAAEKADKLETELRGILAEARTAENPGIFEGVLRDLREEAVRDAPALVAKIDEAGKSLKKFSILRALDKIDMSFASTPVGYRRVTSDLEDVAKSAGGLGADGKGVLEAIEKKRKEALEKFSAGAESQFADLDRRLGILMSTARYEEAERDLKLFRDDYKDTPAAGKADELAAKLEKAKREYDASWLKPGQADWKSQLGDAKVTWNADGFTLEQAGTATSLTDTSRRLVCGKTEASWQDYEVQFELNLEKFGGSALMRMEEREPLKIDFPVPVNNGPGVPAGQWITVRLKVVGEELEMSGSLQAQTVRINGGRGAFGFVALPGGKFHVRNFKLRKIK